MFATVAIASSVAFATETVTFHGQVGGSGGFTGGLFHVSSATGLSGTNVQAGDHFYTFCIELDEFISSGTYDAQVNTSAITGYGARGADTDSNVGDGMDELDYRTAYLYSTYLGAALGDVNTAHALQLAIWSIEEGIDVQTFSVGGVDQSVRDAADAYLTDAYDAVNGGAWGQTWGNVRVINIGGAANNWNKQDMLVIIPLPHASALAGLGLLGVVVRRRRNAM